MIDENDLLCSEDREYRSQHFTKAAQPSNVLKRHCHVQICLTASTVLLRCVGPSRFKSHTPENYALSTSSIY